MRDRGVGHNADQPLDPPVLVHLIDDDPTDPEGPTMRHLREHRQQVIERLLHRGVSRRTLTALLPEFEVLIEHAPSVGHG